MHGLDLQPPTPPTCLGRDHKGKFVSIIQEASYGVLLRTVRSMMSNGNVLTGPDVKNRRVPLMGLPLNESWTNSVPPLLTPGADHSCLIEADGEHTLPCLQPLCLQAPISCTARIISTVTFSLDLLDPQPRYSERCS